MFLFATKYQVFKQFRIDCLMLVFLSKSFLLVIKYIELLVQFYNWIEIISFIFMVKMGIVFPVSFSIGGRSNVFILRKLARYSHKRLFVELVCGHKREAWGHSKMESLYQNPAKNNFPQFCFVCILQTNLYC